MHTIKKYMPVFAWGSHYSRHKLANDMLAAVIVTIMLIPQSLAYAMLAGLPPEIGLYASILPLVAYGLFGSSNTLAVGPVAVVSLMTASAIGRVVDGGIAEYIAAASLMAAMSGLFLLVMGLFKMGFLANFLSHPVISGFITASGILIACSQLKHILGISAGGDTLPSIVGSLASHLDQANPHTLVLGISVTLFLFWVRNGLKPLLMKAGFSDYAASMLAKTGPIFGVLITSLLAFSLHLDSKGIALVGTVPAGLPGFALPEFSTSAWRDLFFSAVLISIIGFVESVSVGHTLAAKRRERIAPDQELLGLGAANIASSVSGGFPVTGGFARSVVNFDAGAETPAAGIYTAAGIAFVALFFTPYLAWLPKA
ncbi:MAG: sodium-independent anion transporter, partial [Pseudomonadales bacterium]|nr:sodium-independent anion transporter [Pseudomonadales bacterium]